MSQEAYGSGGDNIHSRKVTLPSGKIIEVVWFDDPNEAIASEVVDIADPEIQNAIQPDPTLKPLIDRNRIPYINRYDADIERDDRLDNLHICPKDDCKSELVYPLDWEEAGPSDWDVVFCCPNCEWRGASLHPQERVERYDEELDRGTEALVRDVKRLMHANFEDEIDWFSAALHEDHIQPDDF